MIKTKLFIYTHFLIFILLFAVPGKLSANSLVENMQSQIDTRISGVSNATSSLPMFTTRGAGAGTTWVRNASIWTNQGQDIDWSGIATYNNAGGYLHAATLISPKHVVLATHYSVPDGTILTFVKNDNTVVTRTIVSQISIGNDITVGMLDSAVPVGITYYKIAPSVTDLASRLGIINYVTPGDNNVSDYNIPLISIDQEKKVSIHQTTFISDSAVSHSTYSYSTTSTRYLFSHPTIPGDSGNPMFLLIDNTPVLVSLHTYTTSGTYYGSYVTQINNAMDSLSGTDQYSPEVFSIDGYVVSSPGAPDLLSAYDTNISTDNITATTTPRVEVSCVNGATVSLFSNNTQVGSGACSSGVYGYTFSTLAEGEYEIEATQTVGTSTSGTSTALDIIIDTSAPSTPVSAPDLLDISDTGASSTDNYTAESLPKFLVPCTLGNSVLLYVGGSISNTGSCDGTNAVIQAGSSISYGVKTITYKERDIAGNVSSSSPSLTVNFDTSNTIFTNIDGTLDTTFNAGGFGFRNGGSSATINSMIKQSATGKYIVAGNFTTYNTSSGTTSIGRIARLNTDGTLDTTFNAGGFGAGAEVMFMGVQSTGKIIIAGNFTAYNSSIGTTTVGRIARLNADGSLDATFSSGTGFSASVFSSAISQNMLIDSQDRIILSALTSTTYTYNGTAPEHRRFIRLNANGTLDATFNAGGYGPNSAASARVISLASGKYLVMLFNNTISYHDAVNGTTTNAFFMRLNSDGTRDTTFNTGGAGFSGSLSTPGLEMWEDPDSNNIYLATTGGSFGITYNGNTINSSIIKMSADGTTVDTSFNTGLLADGYKPTAFKYVGDGRFLVGLSKTNISSNYSWGGFSLGDDTNIMRFVIVKNGGVENTYSHKYVSTVNSFDVDSIGRVVIAGAFTTYDGVTVGGVARITKTTTPSVLRFVATSPNKTYKIGDTVNIAAIFSEPIKPTSSMAVMLNTGRTVSLTTVSTSTSLQGVYSVEEGDITSDLTVSSVATTTVIDTLGNTFSVFSIPSGNIANTADISIDGIRPIASVPVLLTESDTGIYSTDNITSDTTPTFTVACTVGNEVSIFNSATFVASSTCSTNPVEITSPVLGAGTYNFVSVETDINGNVSSTSTPALVVIFDVEYSGSSPNIPDMDNTSDTGNSSTDNVTSDTTPTFTGSCTTGELVSLSISGNTPVYVTCIGSSYTYTPSALPEETYTLVVAFVDVAGNNSLPSSGLSFTISSSAVVTPTTVTSVPVVGPTAHSVAVLSRSEVQAIFGKNTQKPSVNTVNSNTKVDLGTSITFTANSSLNSKKNKPSEVKALQVFLNQNGYTISKSGIGSPGKETTIFGTLTQKALMRFQKAHAIPATGVLDKKTRDFINKK